MANIFISNCCLKKCWGKEFLITFFCIANVCELYRRLFAAHRRTHQAAHVPACIYCGPCQAGRLFGVPDLCIKLRYTPPAPLKRGVNSFV